MYLLKIGQFTAYIFISQTLQEERFQALIYQKARLVESIFDDSDQHINCLRVTLTKVVAGLVGVVYRLLVSLVGKAPVCYAGGSGSIPGRTTIQGLKIIEEKVLTSANG